MLRTVREGCDRRADEPRRRIVPILGEDVLDAPEAAEQLELASWPQLLLDPKDPLVDTAVRILEAHVLDHHRYSLSARGGRCLSGKQRDSVEIAVEEASRLWNLRTNLPLFAKTRLSKV